jgi:thiosulfate/3-mercaptopyruvate sulfurtransferase
VNAYCESQWLEQHLHDPAVRIIEASIARETYDAAHIPGASWVDFHADLLRNGDDSSGLIPTAVQYAALMSRLSITPQSTVVWYGDRHSSYAIRGFWMMDYYQHPAPFYVLDGGRERWQREGRPMSAAPTTLAPTEYPVPSFADDSNDATWQQVRDAIDASGAVILDVRSVGEYNGSEVRARYGGHIPSAVNIEWTDATSDPNVLKPVEQLRDMFQSRGVTPDKEVITHCQLGIRAAHTWFVLKHVLGYPRVRNYSGSWREWGNRDDLPIER